MSTPNSPLHTRRAALKGKKQAAKRGEKDITGYSDFREFIARKDIDIIHF